MPVVNRNCASILARLRRFLVVVTAAGFVTLAAPSPDALADSLREVAERLAREHDGKVVSARVVERNGRRYYVIRILTDDGVVRTFRVPAGDRAS